MPLPEPHRKFVDFAKRNLSGLGMLVVANIIFMIAYQFALSVVMVPLFMLMMFLQIGFIPLSLLSGGICAPFFCLFMVVFFIVLLGIEVVAISAMYGWYIYLARKVLDVKKGHRIELNGIIDEVRTDWNYYFKKGAGMLGFYMLIIMPIMIVIMIVPAIVMISLVLSMMDTQYFILAFILYYLAIIVLSTLISPIIQFILDVGSLRIAQGMGPWEGMFESLKDIRRRRRLFGSYYLTMLLVTFASFLLFPLASLIRWVLPVATKAFIVANDDL